MKRVVFREYRQMGALTCGVCSLLVFAVLLFLFLTVPPANPNINIIDCALPLIIFLAIGIAGICCSFSPKNGIKSIKIDDTNMTITSYDEDKKEVLTKILLKDILSFKFDIKCDYDYKQSPYTKNYHNVVITVNIECSNEENYEYTFHTEDYAKIKQMFSVAKYIPKFSYDIATNSQEVYKNIVHLAQTGKNLSLTEYFKTYFANPEVPESKKAYAKILMVILAVYTLVAVVFICKLIFGN